MKEDEIKYNPLLATSDLPYNAPAFDKIKIEHYLPAFEAAIKLAKENVKAIVEAQEDGHPARPDFWNTVQELEWSRDRLDSIEGIFFNLNEADTSDEMQEIADKVALMLNDYSMFVVQNEELFERVKECHDDWADGRTYWWSGRMSKEDEMLLKKTYKSFVRSGAGLSGEGKELFKKYSEELSLLGLQFQKNLLAATNAFVLNLIDEADLEGLPGYVVEAAGEAARERGLEGWAFTLHAPSYRAFMKFSARRELRRKMYIAYNTRAVGGEYDNTDVVRKIVQLRTRLAHLLDYSNYAEYALEERMAKAPLEVNHFLNLLLEKTLPYAKKDVKNVRAYARRHGFTEKNLEAWDFSYWAERLRESKYSVNEEELKPYFELDNCIKAIFSLANRLYGITFEQRTDIPVYHEDVRVYDVKDEDGTHLALFYADFFPRESKRGGAWMTEFRGQHYARYYTEHRPYISIVTNFTKTTATTPSLITHDEFTTLLHEFGHALHGMLSRCHYESLSGTNVARDFVELPSQIMENWAFEPEYLRSFAKDYRTGKVIPQALVNKIVKSKNYLAGYYQVRQLQFGILDMAWHTRGDTMPVEDIIGFEKQAIGQCVVLPDVPECAISMSFSHIFSGGYAAGYYSYKWAEVLEADAFSFFTVRGIFNRVVASLFRYFILEKGGSEDADVLYRKFRGHDPDPQMLLWKLGLY